MNATLAAEKVAERFVKNTKVKGFDPMWIVAIVEVIIYVIKYCDQKNDLNKFKGVVQSAMSPLGKYFGVGRRARASLRKAISTHLIEANCEELMKAMLETTADAKDEEILGLIEFVGKVDHTP